MFFSFFPVKYNIRPKGVNVKGGVMSTGTSAKHFVELKFKSMFSVPTFTPNQIINT